MLFIHTTCENIEKAKKLGDIIIQEKLGACVDYWPVSSCFEVNGKNVCQTKVKLLITTFESKLDEITNLITANYSEAVPLVAGIDVRRINHPYKEWMMEVIH